MSSCSAASRREAPPSTRAITRMRMSAEYAFGIVRPPDESMPPDSPTYRSLGTLRFYSARTCSSLRTRRAGTIQGLVGWRRPDDRFFAQGPRLLRQRHAARVFGADHLAFGSARAPARDGARDAGH